MYLLVSGTILFGSLYLTHIMLGKISQHKRVVRRIKQISDI